ncbi:capsule biosynthesis protein [Thioclava sp. FR2]|uniref:capsule biosynthesis protein n=1 Tax=Thioclava sp. FR2 TaxID=3445780 RepID=UPI003EB6F951
MKLKIKRYNLRRDESPAAAPLGAVPPRLRAVTATQRVTPAPSSAPSNTVPASPSLSSAVTPVSAIPLPPAVEKSADPAASELEQIRREGLTGRQLRMARRLAQKHGLPATSDFDAVRLLRAKGLDPFGKNSLMEMLSADGDILAEDGDEDTALSTEVTVTSVGATNLPQTVKATKLPSTEVRTDKGQFTELMQIQRDIARRRRRRSALLAARLFFFVFLPTLLAGWYYYVVATPLYATKTEFVIQQAAPSGAGAGGLGGLLSGTQFATSQDSIAVQGYLQSRDAMLRLDKDKGFRSHFSDQTIDPIQRLAPNATVESSYKLYSRNVKIAYDPTEGIIKMEVIAADPNISAQFSEALIGYAEEQVDHLTQRLREDQMRGARESYQEAEAAMLAAQRRVVELQEQFKVLSSEVEVTLITSQIGQLETQLSQDRLSLAQMEANAQPNAARMEPLKRRIATLESEIAILRAKLTEGENGGQSLAQVQSELLVAQSDVQTRQLLLAQSLQAMETARNEANRQVRYLSISVAPIPPDEASYPRAFENTMVALLIFAGIYLMISMTAAILREQVSA